VYLNIGSLFQSNALSAGISFTDTNWQFVLSQADGVLRFTSTTLTPTNYMNFLRDTTKPACWWLSGGVGNTAGARLTTITTAAYVAAVVYCRHCHEQSGHHSGGSGGPHDQPLVLTIYHGTNQIAQTQLYLSINGVEQMFRSKTILVNPQPQASRPPDGCQRTQRARHDC